MSFTAGYKGIVRVKTTDVAMDATDDVGGVESAGLPDGVEMLDTTSINNTNGEPSAIPGIRIRGPYAFTCNLDTADTGQGRLFTALSSRAKIYMTNLPDGTNGLRFAIYVNKADRKMDAKGKAMVDFEVTFAGDAPTAVP